MMKFLQIPIVFCAVLMIANCSKPSDDPPELTNAEKLATGWEEYEADRIYDARDMFRDVISDELLGGEALAGIAWCAKALNQLDSTEIYANLAITDGYTEVDMPILLAAVQLANEQFSEAISTLEDVTISSGWVFVHDPVVNYEDYVLILGYSHYHLGNFAETITYVLMLEPSVTIDPEDSGTWSYLGTDYSELGLLLLAVLNDFSGVLT